MQFCEEHENWNLLRHLHKSGCDRNDVRVYGMLLEFISTLSNIDCENKNRVRYIECNEYEL